MTIRPGRNLIRTLIAMLVISPIVFVIPVIKWLLIAVGLIAIAVAVFEYRRLRRSLDSVTVRRSVPKAVGRGRPFRVNWILERQGLDRDTKATVRGEWREYLPVDVEPAFVSRSFELTNDQSTVDFDAELTIPIRGEFSIGPTWLRVAGRFGILEAQRSFDVVDRVRVLPETYHSPDELLKDAGADRMLLDKPSQTRHHGVGTEFESLNEFRDGDDPRRIDWRTTARLRHLIVRRYQIERHRDVMIVLDCGRLMGADAGRGSKLDCAIDASLMVARVALQSGDRCGIALFDDQILGYLPPVSGVSSVGAIADSIYHVQTRWRESDFARMFATLQQRQSKRSLIVIVSDMVDAETTTRFRASLSRLARRHVVLFAALQTPVLEELISAPSENSLDTSRKAVTYRLLREREQALHSVRRGGVNVLDVTPAQLTVPLINRFVELREKSLI